MGSGIVISWVFGREFTDHTVASLFALPTSRSTIAAAKFVVFAIWATALCLVVVAAAFALAPLAGLPVPHLDDTGAAVKVVVIGISGAMLTTPLALVATIARGYLPAVSALILIVVVTQVVTLVGIGAWFPYADGAHRMSPGLLIESPHPVTVSA
jgi:ABC-2 type transport system permease protein